MKGRLKIDIIGRGNVGTHLAAALAGGCDVTLCSGRTLEGLRADTDLYIIAVPDGATGETGRRLASHPGVNAKGVIAHTSGSNSIGVLADTLPGHGVFYPLQTFTRGRAIDYATIPFLIEGSDEATAALLEEAARSVSRRVIRAGSEERFHIHVASVLACNLANRLWTLSCDYLGKHGLCFDILSPLIAETAAKAMRSGNPRAMQTGPARRNDMKTVAAHLEALEENPEAHEAYRILSEGILAEADDPEVNIKRERE